MSPFYIESEPFTMVLTYIKELETVSSDVVGPGNVMAKVLLVVFFKRRHVSRKIVACFIVGREWFGGHGSPVYIKSGKG